MKKNIAIIIPGGIGTGRNNIGIPVLERIIRMLLVDFNITVFQLFPVNKNFETKGFEVIDTYSSNRILKSMKFFWAFWRIHRIKQFHAVHGFWALPGGFLATIVGRIFHIKSMISLQGGDAIALPEINYGQLQRWLPRKLALWSMHQTDELLSPTRYMIDGLQIYGLKRSKIQYIPLGVDNSLFRFNEKNVKLPVRFLHIGNFNRVKDQQTLLKAFKIISDAVASKLTIIGEGDLENELKSLAFDLNLNDKITFQQPVPYESLPGYYHQSDILLHTSLSEGHPIVVEEAMSCGIVVCGTRVGILYDQPTCCISVPLRDFEKLGYEVLELLKDPDRMNTIRDNARSWASIHSLHWTVEKIKELYH